MAKIDLKNWVNYNRVRQYVNTLPYEQQYTKGLEILKMFADQLGETIIWL